MHQGRGPGLTEWDHKWAAKSVGVACYTSKIALTHLRSMKRCMMAPPSTGQSANARSATKRRRQPTLVWDLREVTECGTAVISSETTTPSDRAWDILLGTRVSLAGKVRHSSAKHVDNGRQTEAEHFEECLNGNLEQHIGCKVRRGSWLYISSAEISTEIRGASYSRRRKRPEAMGQSRHFERP